MKRYLICAVLICCCCTVSCLLSESTRAITGQLTSPGEALRVMADYKSTEGFNDICSIQAVNSTGGTASGIVGSDGNFTIAVAPGSWLFGFLNCDGSFVATLILNNYSILTIEEGTGAIDLGEIILSGNIARVSGSSVSGVEGATDTDSDHDGLPDAYECTASDSGWDGSTSGDSGGTSSSGDSGDGSDDSAEAESSVASSTAEITCESDWRSSGGDSSDSSDSGACDNLFYLGYIYPFEGGEFTPSEVYANGLMIYIGGYCLDMTGVEDSSSDLTIVESNLTNETITLEDSDGVNLPLTFSVDGTDIIATFNGESSMIEECATYTLTILGGESGVTGIYNDIIYVLGDEDEDGNPTDSFTSTFATIHDDYTSCD